MIGRNLLDGFEPTARRWLKASFVSGIAFSVFLIWLDAFSPRALRTWWHGLSLGYTNNILAAATGFLIGVPVTVVVIDRFKSNLAEKIQTEAQIASVNRVSKAAWRDFAEAVDEFCNDERVEAVNHRQDRPTATDQLQAEHDLIIERLQACRAAIASNPNSALAEIANLKPFLASHSTTLEARRRAVDQQFGTKYYVRRNWNYIVSRWRVLDEYVRVRRIEFELEPIPRNYYETILDALSSGDDNDLYGFLDAHSGAKSSRWRGIAAILDLQHIVDIAIGMPDAQLANMLANHYDDWIGPGLKQYWTKALGAHIFLTSLEMRVQTVTLSGWPQNATRPRRQAVTDSETSGNVAVPSEPAAQPTTVEQSPTDEENKVPTEGQESPVLSDDNK
ncbi:hypothetical protein AAHS21_26870 [Mycobacterium sp. 050272]|uniref:hypothetical protein n=1 Tax=Mycobacterium sp. 050272 TaxID=3142488 RepID=UPI00319CED02